jgi:predicted HAD superfamily Cof-like phosphohydrolase
MLNYRRKILDPKQAALEGRTPNPLTGVYEETMAEFKQRIASELEALLEPVVIFDPVADIEEFHKKFELTYEGKPRTLPKDLVKFRQNFLNEELAEYEASANKFQEYLDIFHAYSQTPDPNVINHALELQLDALVDLVYVALGTAYLHGFNFKEAWRRVHAANMQKVRATKASESQRNSTHDVVKPPGWQPPSHLDLVKDNTHVQSKD